MNVRFETLVYARLLHLNQFVGIDSRASSISQYLDPHGPFGRVAWAIKVYGDIYVYVVTIYHVHTNPQRSPSNIKGSMLPSI